MPTRLRIERAAASLQRSSGISSSDRRQDDSVSLSRHRCL